MVTKSRSQAPSLVQICMGHAFGGPHMYLLRVAEEAERRGYQAVVVTSAGSELERRAHTQGYKVLGLRPDDRSSVWNQLKRTVDPLRCQSVHLHSIRGLPRGFISLPAHVQMCLTEHSYRRREVLHPLSRMALSRVDVVLAISEAVAKTNSHALGIDRSRVQILHHGVDLDRFHPDRRREQRAAARAKLRFQETDRVVLVPTVFRRLAQVSTLIEAIHEMKGEEDVHLLLTGALKSDRQSADTRADLERQIRSLGVRSQVHFTGYLEHIEDAYAAADVVAIPTRYEAFGLPALEAMAVGLPALGSSTGAFAELVEDGSSGTCLDVRDARAWVDALHAVLGDPEAAARMGEAGRQRAVENFSIVDHWDRLFEIYASGRRHPGPKIAIG